MIDKVWYEPEIAREDRRKDWRPKEKQACKRCGATGLHWVEYKIGKFALYKGTVRHTCNFATDFD